MATSNKALPGSIEVWDTDRVLPYELNAKIHDPKQVAKIAKSITEFGFDQPIVVDKNGVVIKGHGRRLAAISLGMKQVPVWVRSDLSEERVRASRLADNRVAISDIDTELFKKEMESLNFDLDGIFDLKELTFMEADLGEINDGAFVDDIDLAVADQAKESAKKVEEIDARDVKIEKALGFKVIKGKDEKYVAAFMAEVEAQTELTGADAFVSFIKALTAK